MKKTKRILALLGVILLVSMYLATLVFALIDHPRALDCLKASFGLTIFIPVLLWIHLAIFRYMEQKKSSDEQA